MQSAFVSAEDKNFWTHSGYDAASGSAMRARCPGVPEKPARDIAIALQVLANKAVYAANRALMMDGLRAAGLGAFAPPDGAFYIYVDVSAYTDDARAFAAEILDQAGVAVTPGLDFDAARGHHWLRFSYARGTVDISEGLDRIARFMQARRA